MNRQATAAKKAETPRRNEEIEQVISCHHVHIYRIYEKSMLKKARLAGKVTFAFSINKNGTVTYLRVDSTNIKDGDFLADLSAYLKTLQFNSASHDGVYRYPIEFMP